VPVEQQQTSSRKGVSSENITRACEEANGQGDLVGGQEERDVGEEEDKVEDMEEEEDSMVSAMTEGTVVWAKIAGDPWWPAVLFPNWKSGAQFTCFTGTGWYRNTNSGAAGSFPQLEISRRTQFTSSTGTKLQILTLQAPQ
jgi:hypothetical protein